MSLVAASLVVVACAGPEPGPASPPLPSSDPAPTATAAAAPTAAATATAAAPPDTVTTASSGSAGPWAPASALDLSTPEKARTTIREVLMKGDKEAFRRCVTKRILERQRGGFDAWFQMWKEAADIKPPATFDKIIVTQEDGAYKLDEN